jgi:hypothetical protein
MNYFEVFMQTRQWIRFCLKKRHPPPPCCFAWKFEGKLTKFTIRVFRSSILSGEIFVSFWKFQPSLCKSTKFVFEFCGLDPIGRLALVDTATLCCFNHDFLRISARAPCSFITTMLSRKNFQQFALKKNLYAYPYTFTWSKSSCKLFGENPFVDGILGHNLLLSRAFLVGIPSWMGFLGHNLLLSRAFFGGNPFVDGIFRPQLVVFSGLLFHDGIQAITKPLS